MKNVKLRSFLSKKSADQYDILLFPGCVLTNFYSSIIKKIIDLLEKNGFSVVVPKGLQCCGMPYLSQGWKKWFERLKEKNQHIFSRFRYRYLLVPCGAGTFMFRKYYRLDGVEVFEFTEFLHQFLKDLPVDRRVTKEGNVGFHDPCHHRNTLQIKEAPRHFLNKLGDRYVNDESELCCGFGGLFRVGFPITSSRILERRSRVLRELDVDVVFTSCPGCMMQLEQYLPQRVRFFVDLFLEE